MQHAVRSVQRAACSMQHAACSMHTPLMPRDAVGDATLQRSALQRPVNQRQAIKAFVPSDRLLIVVTGGAVFATPDRQVA